MKNIAKMKRDIDIHKKSMSEEEALRFKLNANEARMKALNAMVFVGKGVIRL